MTMTKKKLLNSSSYFGSQPQPWHPNDLRVSFWLLLPVLLLIQIVPWTESSTKGTVGTSRTMRNKHTQGFDQFAAHIMQQPVSINLSPPPPSSPLTSSTSSSLASFRPFKRTLQAQQQTQASTSRPKTQPLRIRFITSPIKASIAQSTNQDEIDGGNLVLTTILPPVQKVLQDTIKVEPRSKNNNNDSITFPRQVCSGIYSNFLDSTHSVDDADMVIIVSAYETVNDQEGNEIIWCNPNPQLTTLASATTCAQDVETYRPVVGLLNICLSAISRQSIPNMEEIITHELVHTLVMSEYLFPFFRSAVDGSSLSDNPLREQRIPCVNGNDPTYFFSFSDRILQHNTENVKYNDGYTKRSYYELTLPTVRQVVRNQFNCQSLTGARLENQPTNPYSCIGSHFDERFFQYHTMSAIYDSTSEYFNPLTLALLEDSGWYGVDFRKGLNSPFGIAAGCDFVTKDCIDVDNGGKLPNYSRGNFCNVLQSDNQWMCDPGHNYRGQCDLYNYLTIQTSDDIVKPGRQYFPNSFLGPVANVHSDWCPTVYKFRDASAECTDKTALKIDDLEVFGDTSRCLDVTINGARKSTSLCIDAFCDNDQHQFVFDIGGTSYSCGVGDDFKEIEVIASDRTLRITCPKLVQACPDMFCPSMCSGKGICDWDTYPVPLCKCFNTNDTSSGCFDSPANDPNSSWQDPTSVLVSIFSLSVILHLLF